MGLKDLSIPRAPSAALEEGYGQYLIASCSANQSSMEAEDLAGGLFTACILQGLEGSADLDRDTQVSVDELIGFLKTRLPKEAKKRGKVQTPLVEVYSSEGTLRLTK